MFYQPFRALTKLLPAALFLLVSQIVACTPLAPAMVPSIQSSTNFGKVVVVDIDGTLTPDVMSVFTAREDAAKALWFYADQGYGIVYLSARVAWWSTPIPEWLHKEGFPPGAIHVAQNSRDREQPDVFKTSLLQQYKRKGWELAYAYGDSSTDFTAYKNAGLSQSQIFALQRASANQCQEGPWERCLKTWSAHIPKIQSHH